VCLLVLLNLPFPDNDDLIAQTIIVGIILALDTLHSVSYMSILTLLQFSTSFTIFRHEGMLIVYQHSLLVDQKDTVADS